MIEIFWTMLASQDRKRIREYIAEQNLMAAIEFDERIGYSVSSLAGQPYKGRHGRVEGTRELVIHLRPVLYGLLASFHLYADHGYAELAQPFATQSPQTATSGERFRRLTGNRLSH